MRACIITSTGSTWPLAKTAKSDFGILNIRWKKRRFRHNGAQYRISPFALAWDDENYYMLGYDAQAGILKHYRVDKMTEIQPLDAPRQGNEQFQKLDMADYSRKVFSMFGGEEEMVRPAF